ncbi:hypothetical protein Mapa_008082 [Marchantia paleacea]|nr:hypothetical protein Mapa_008082 [Marchantia paleacea]
MILVHQFFVTLHQDDPVPVQEVGTLQISLLGPLLLLRQEQVDECGLIVSFEFRSAVQIFRQQLATFRPGLAFGAIRSPGVQDVQRPLTVPNEKASRVETNPAPLLVQQVIPAVQNHVVVFVLVHGKLELHVGEERVAVHPPNPLDLRVTEHKLAQKWKFGPETRHFHIKMSHVVENLDIVKAAVVDFVLEILQDQVVSHWVVARFGLRTRH